MTCGASFNFLQANLKAQFFILNSTLKLDSNIFLFPPTNSFTSLTHFQEVTARSSSTYLESMLKFSNHAILVLND